MQRSIVTTLILSLTLAASAWAQGGKLTIHVDQPATRVSPTIYGLMTEEINHAYDGGLYAELIQNRIFKDGPLGARNAPTTLPDSPLHWSAVGDAKISRDETNPVNTTALTESLRVDIEEGNTAPAGVANEGYWGIPVWPNTQYHVSFYARGVGVAGPLTASIQNQDGKTTYASGQVQSVTGDWKKYELNISTGNVKETGDARFVITANSPGKIWFSLVSLFPPTFHNRPNGLRIDIMEKMLAMHPAFLRFPGGNYLEGPDIDNYFDWKKTIGPLEDRPGHQCPWDYRSTDGMGLLEFLEWCEDLHMEPVLAVFAGYTLNGQSVPQESIGKYVQDAMDEIEYVDGEPSTTWGARRAKDGHEMPFPLRFVEIGNEDNGGTPSRTYEWRYKAFHDAIKAKYPKIDIIATAHVRNTPADLFDDHTYSSEQQMYQKSHTYDPWPRTGPKIFFGEWATRSGGTDLTPNLGFAMSDAAFLQGLERDSDVVKIASYAPLFVNVTAGPRNAVHQWMPDLIGYNNLTSFGSASYYMQKMYAENRGDVVLPAEVSMAAPETIPQSHGGIGVGTWATTAEFKDVKVTKGGASLYESDFVNHLEDWIRGGGRGRGAPSPWTVNDGALRQTGNGTVIMATTGDNAWTDYTISLKAHKISGTEGFLVSFHNIDSTNFVWWNVGGWGNTEAGLEQTIDGAKMDIGDRKPVVIDADKWYDLRIEVTGHDVKCYLDDKLTNEATEKPFVSTPMYLEATRVDDSGDVILKVVNSKDADQQMQIDLTGAKEVSADGKLELLTGKPADVNTIDNPTKVVTQYLKLSDAAKSFTHTFPGNSVSVIRLSVK